MAVLRRRLPYVAGILLLPVVALVVPPFLNISHYQKSITGSISRSLGRPVHASAVHLRLLPVPGIEMTDLVVEEDPAFGAEPALQSASVLASLRLSSLWRGRLEVSRIRFDEPSLNLVRNDRGRWNLGSVLMQASRIPNAPTGQAHRGPEPRFPYIELSSGRINFKTGAEKRPFSLLNADVSIWQANRNEWQVRVKAQPVRTDLDLDLSDTGTLLLEGSLERGSNLNEAPLKLRATWEDAQLGQATRLLLGRGTGWRGDMRVTAQVSGDVQDLKLKTQVEIAGPHRQEFTPVAALDVNASCNGEYRTASHSIEDLLCLWPVSPGHLLLRGTVANLDDPQPALKLEINSVPAEFFARALGLLRQRAGEITATGAVNGEFTGSGWKSEAMTGSATAEDLALHLPGIAAPVTAETLRIHTADEARKRRGKGTGRRGLLLDATILHLGGMPPGAKSSLSASGELRRKGFSLHLTGDAPVGALLALSRQSGVLASTAAALQGPGTAQMDVTVDGPWLMPVAEEESSEASMEANGLVQFSNASLVLPFLAQPVAIRTATLAISPTEIAWKDANVTTGGLAGRVSASYPASCADGVAQCPAQFTLELTKADGAAVRTAIAGGGGAGELIARLLSSAPARRWPRVSGSIHAATFALGPLVLENALASLRTNGEGVAQLTMDADALGGTAHASGEIRGPASAPAWNLNVQLNRVNAGGAAALFHEAWGQGSITASAQFRATGNAPAEVAGSAEGKFRWMWDEGSIGEDSPLAHFDAWTADGTFMGGTLTILQSALRRGAESSPVEGTITFSRRLHLAIGGDPAQAIGGTLADPVTEQAATQP